MKIYLIRFGAIALAVWAHLSTTTTALGAAPPLLNFQGRIVIGGASYNGAGQFQFALVDDTGATTYWSNDGTSSGGGEPASPITLTLTNGLYAVLLGDTNVTGMSQPLNAGVFTNADVRLRVWFNDGTHGFEKLTPDQRMAAAGYALVADTANNFSGSISSAQLPANLATTNFVLSQGFVTATVTNGLATIGYVNAATNGLVTAAITNGLASTNFVTSQGYVTASVTNGLATTNFVLSQGFVTAAVTNGLATISYVNAATNGLVTAAITNGLATTNFVTAQGYVTASVTNGLATTNFVLSQGFVTAAVTNGLATIGYVNAITNGQVTTNFVTTLGYVKTVWSGTTGGNIAANTTDYLTPNNTAPPSGANGSYLSGFTGSPATSAQILTNLYVIAGLGNAGNKTLYNATFTVLTNGVASPLAVTISGTNTNQVGRTFSNTTNSVAVAAGTEIGVVIAVAANPGGGTNTVAAPYSWSFQGR